MTHYLVTAYPDHTKLLDLHEELQDGQVKELSPFGQELDQALRRARMDPFSGKALWEEEDHCTPPLAAERQAVLDQYFEEIQVEEVQPGEGWEEIEELPSLWQRWGVTGHELPGPAEL